jgi:hypothetical protein
MGKARAISGGPASSAGGANQLTITVPGTLAIGSNAGQVPAFYNAAVQWNGFTLAVGSAPTGTSPSTLEVNVGLAGSPETVLFTLTIALGANRVSATTEQITAAGTIPSNTNIVLDILDVGNDFPGANLTANAW